MTPSDVVQALVVAHGDLARFLIETVESLAGPQAGLRALSNRDCSLPILVERIEVEARTMDPGPLVIFVDLLGGSCSQAGRMVVRGHPDWRVVTGVNVPMLVNFVQNRGRLELEPLIDMLIARAREGVQRFPEAAGGLDARSTG